MNDAARTGLTALILAGGRGRRMGGLDKGLVPLNGRPLIAHILESIAPHVDAVLINANRNQERYAAYGYPVLADPLEDYQGPLAGFAAGMAASETPLLLTLPCDGPMVAPDLARRLNAALQDAGAEIAVAHDGKRMQPVYALLECGLLPSLRAFLAAGERKIDKWYGLHHTLEVDFSDCPEQFVNVNTPEDRAQLERSVGGNDGGAVPGRRNGGNHVPD